MRCVTYNIQYGIGLDGRYDLTRVVEAVRGADVIALQEVTRNNPRNDGRDLVAEIRTLLPDYFAVFGSPFRIDIGSRIEDGRAVDRFFEFGNMILSKTPVIASRTLLLPRRRSYGRIDMQRSALEALIGTPLGPIRFYCVHLDHLSPDERLAQVRFLLDRATLYALEGGAVSGVAEWHHSEPPYPDAFVLTGDFNMQPNSPEYVAMTGTADPFSGVPLRAGHGVDAALIAAEGDTGPTWIDPERQDDLSRRLRIDYCFVQAGLVPHIRRLSVDRTATGSDHLPVWLELA